MIKTYVDRFQEESNNNNFEPSSISQEYNGEDVIPEAAPTDAAFLPITDTSSYGANDIGSTAATGFDTNVQSSQASFGANGGQVNGGNYGPQQTTSFVPNGQQYSALHQDSNGGSSSFIPQVLHRINDEDRKNYLPPNYRL